MVRWLGHNKSCPRVMSESHSRSLLAEDGCRPNSPPSLVWTHFVYLQRDEGIYLNAKKTHTTLTVSQCRAAGTGKQTTLWAGVQNTDTSPLLPSSTLCRDHHHPSIHSSICWLILDDRQLSFPPVPGTRCPPPSSPQSVDNVCSLMMLTK